MDQVTVITPVGCIGNRGVDKDAFIRAIDETQPHAFAMDAGSMDCGPWYLGAGKAHSPTLDILWDLEHVLCQAVPRGIPVVIGSAGGCAVGDQNKRLHVVMDVAANFHHTGLVEDNRFRRTSGV